MTVPTDTKSRIFEHFRKAANLHFSMLFNPETLKYDYHIFDADSGKDYFTFAHNRDFIHTFEEAEKRCIDKMIELANTKLFY